MLWFKHYSKLSRDPKVVKLESLLGLVGYAQLIKTIELCADQLEGKKIDTTFVFSARYYQNEMRTKRKQVEIFLRTCTDLAFFKATLNDNIITICFPKLLEIRDNHTKIRTGFGPDSDPVEKEKDKEKERENKRAQVPKNLENLCAEFINTWNENRGDQDAAPLVLNADTHKKIRAALKEIKKIDDWKILMQHGTRNEFWKKNVSFRWLINPEKIESVHRLLTEAKATTKENKKAIQRWL